VIALQAADVSPGLKGSAFSGCDDGCGEGNGGGAGNGGGDAG
jgi:hypothetical protein